MSKLNKLAVAMLALVVAVPAFAAKPDYVQGAYYVKFKSKASKADKDMLKGHGAALRGEFPDLDVVEIQLDNSQAVENVSKNLKVEYVEPVAMRYASALATSQ